MADKAISVRELARAVEQQSAHLAQIEKKVAQVDEHVLDLTRTVNGMARLATLPSGVALGNAVQQTLEAVQAIRRFVDDNPNN